MNILSSIDLPRYDFTAVGNMNILSSIHLPHYDFTVLGNIISIFVSMFAIFFIFLISYSTVRVFEIREKEEKFIEHEIALYAEHVTEHERSMHEAKGASRNPRWDKVLNLVFSANSANWRLAVIEADSMLDALMDQMSFKGENLGEKLKNADRDRFYGLSLAWEAHAVRNKIAHEGSSFNLSGNEAKRVITLYEQIFREFGYI